MFLGGKVLTVTLPETNLASKNGGFAIGRSFSGGYFQGRTVSFREGFAAILHFPGGIPMDCSAQFSRVCLYMSSMNFTKKPVSHAAWTDASPRSRAPKRGGFIMKHGTVPDVIFAGLF